MNFKLFINLAVFAAAICDNLVQTHNMSIYELCPFHKKGPSLDVQDVVGSWMTVYMQPKSIDCFKFHIRATTELVFSCQL